MPQSQATDEPSAREAAAARGAAPGAEPEADTWLDDSEPLPRRPRRRLLTPLPLALLAALAIACGFVAGALVEKGQGGSAGSPATAGGAFASRLAALGGGGASTRSGAAAGAAGTAGTRGVGPSGSVTAGQVAYISDHTLYVTTAEGDTVKVTASAAASISKTVKASVESIHPGETVLVTGARAASGAISAESIRAGASAAAGLGAGALFGGSASGGASSSSSPSSQSGGASGGGEPTLFGKGG